MPQEKYPLPPFLAGICTPQSYRNWLGRKAATHHKRDHKRGNLAATREAYKVAIHQAVLDSGGVDEYTGRPLEWAKIGIYRNEESATGRRKYKHAMGDLPTVDHVGDGLSEADFKICAWRVNDAKNDLGLNDFLDLCSQVLEHHKRQCFATVEGELPEHVQMGRRGNVTSRLIGPPDSLPIAIARPYWRVFAIHAGRFRARIRDRSGEIRPR